MKINLERKRYEIPAAQISLILYTHLVVGSRRLRGEEERKKS